MRKSEDIKMWYASHKTGTFDTIKELFTVGQVDITDGDLFANWKLEIIDFEEPIQFEYMDWIIFNITGTLIRTQLDGDYYRSQNGSWTINCTEIRNILNVSRYSMPNSDIAEYFNKYSDIRIKITRSEKTGQGDPKLRKRMNAKLRDYLFYSSKKNVSELSGVFRFYDIADTTKTGLEIGDLPILYKISLFTSYLNGALDTDLNKGKTIKNKIINHCIVNKLLNKGYQAAKYSNMRTVIIDVDEILDTINITKSYKTRKRIYEYVDQILHDFNVGGYIEEYSFYGSSKTPMFNKLTKSLGFRVAVRQGAFDIKYPTLEEKKESKSTAADTKAKHEPVKEEQVELQIENEEEDVVWDKTRTVPVKADNEKGYVVKPIYNIEKVEELIIAEKEKAIFRIPGTDNEICVKEKYVIPELGIFFKLDISKNSENIPALKGEKYCYVRVCSMKKVNYSRTGNKLDEPLTVGNMEVFTEYNFENLKNRFADRNEVNKMKNQFERGYQAYWYFEDEMITKNSMVGVMKTGLSKYDPTKQLIDQMEYRPLNDTNSNYYQNVWMKGNL